MQSKFSKYVAIGLAIWLLAVSFLPMQNQVVMASGNQKPLAMNIEKCQNSDTGSNGYQNWDVGKFKLQTNRWNTTNVTPNASYNECITYDDAATTGDFQVTKQEGTAPTNAGPTSYPSIIAGCHWGNVCSPDTAGMPVQYKNIVSIPSSWAIDTPGSGTWDAAYDIWFDTQSVASNPTSGNGQNDGAEIMIWLDSKGYSNQNSNPPGTVRPTGTIQSASFTAAGYTWDVWIGALTGPAPDNTPWNVISFVRQNAPGNSGSAASSSMIGFDAKNFVDYAAGLTCPNGSKCISKDWWLLSIQAGFEPWTGGVGLTSRQFSAVAKTTTGTTVVTGRTSDTGLPMEDWGIPFTVLTNGCPNSTPTLTISEKHDSTNPVPATPDKVVTGAVEYPAGSGSYSFNVPALYPMHGNVTYTITWPSGCSTPTQTVDGYIDPSGRVRTPAGDAVSGATVTLYRSDTATGPFTVVAAGSDLMSEANRTNPDTTDQNGSFGWDVKTGFYKVRAEKAGCVSPTNPSQTYVETAVMNIPPAVTNIDLRLNCGGNSGLPVVLTKTSDWGSGYCANVKVTNNTASPVDWNVNFSLASLGGGTIYTFWNAVYTQSGNNITNVHANPAYPWNKALKPGESTHDVGFCANR